MNTSSSAPIIETQRLRLRGHRLDDFESSVPPELAAALQFNLKANLTRWLGDALDVTDLAVRPDDATLFIDVTYRCRRTGLSKSANFRREV